jgi:hypothetical protein
MASNKILNIEPQFLPASAGNLLSPGLAPASAVGYTSTTPYIILKHIRVFNTDTIAHSFSLFKGATGGSTNGTQVGFAGSTPVPAGQWVDCYSQIRLDSTDFLTGIADAASKLVIMMAGEVGLS